MTEAAAINGAERAKQTEITRERNQGLDANDQRNVTGAANAQPNPQMQQQALQVTQGDNNGDTFNPVNGATQATGNAARQYGRIDPTNGRGINGTNYTPKVVNQMGAADPYHGFPRLVDNAAAQQRPFAFTGNDGRVRAGVEAPGTVNGKPGNFQYIVEPNGQNVNHRLFVGEGMKNSIPRASIISGTNAARVAGRALLPVAAAMDVHAIATSNDIPRTATEKAGAWAGSLALGGVAAQAAAPMLAAGPVGWVGYGVTVLGAGAVGYFGGEQAARSAYNWAFGR